MGKRTMRKYQGLTLASMEGLTAAGLGCLSFSCIGAAGAETKLVFPAAFALGFCAAWLWRKRGGLRGFSSFKRLWAALLLQGAAGALALGLGLWPLVVLCGLASGCSAYLSFGAYRDIHRSFRALCRIAPGEKRYYMGFGALWSLLGLGTLGLLWCPFADCLRAAVCMSLFLTAGVYILLAGRLCLSDQRGAEILRNNWENIKKN